MAEAEGLSGSQAGLLASANFAGYLAGALLAAAGDPARARGRLLLALGLSAATTAGMGLAQTMPAWVALRVLGGAASAFVLVLASALVLERLARTGREALASLHFAGVGAGIAASAVLVALLDAAGSDWRGLWLASGVLSALTLPAVARLLPRIAPAPARPMPAADGRRRGFARLVLAYGLFGFGYVITATFLVTILRGEPALRPLEPVAWAVAGLAGMPSVALWGALARRVGTGMAFALACLAEAAGVAMSVLWISTAGALLAAALLGGTLLGLTALGLAAARELAPAAPQRAIAVMTAAFGAGQIIGPLAAGLLHDRLGGFLMPSLGAALALVLAAVLVPKHRAP